MARNERSWNQKFIEYQNMIIKHKNYQGLPIVKKADGAFNWVITTPSEIGEQRKSWAEEKARQFGFKIGAGVYADVMREIHPTKMHTCQICGSEMSIYYHYPSVNFVKALNKKFEIEITENDHVGDIWDMLISSDVVEKDLVEYF
jgi:hypothetical protein